MITSARVNDNYFLGSDNCLYSYWPSLQEGTTSDFQDQTIKVCLTREVKAQRGKLILFPLVGVVKIIAMTEAVISRNPKIDTVLGPSKAQTTCFVDLTLLTFIARIIAGNQEQEEALRAMASDKIEAGRPVAR